MKNIFRKHSEAVLISLAGIFVVAMIWFVYGTVQGIVSQVNRVLAPPHMASTQGFDLNSAKRIDYRGLVAASSVTSSHAASPSRTTSAGTSSATSSAASGTSASPSASSSPSTSASAAGAKGSASSSRG